MKFVLVALSVALSLPAGLALAQTAAPTTPGAAATLPNTFDRPGEPLDSEPPPSDEAEDPVKVAAAEQMLRTTIAAMQAGAFNYADMSTDLADRIRPRQDVYLGVMSQLGALTGITHVGVDNGAEVFAVAFANAPTIWVLAQNDAGKIVVLLFRPATPPAAGA